MWSLELLSDVFSGLGPAIVVSAPAAAVFFGTYDYLKKKLPIAQGPINHMVAAVGGDLAQSLIRTPFEVIKQRVQAGVDPNGLIAAANVLKKSGVMGFFTGWGALALRDLPFDLIEYPLYEYLKKVGKNVKAAASGTVRLSLATLMPDATI